MWGGPPFSIPDNRAIGVRSVAAAREWYKEKLGLREIHDRREDDSGSPLRAFVCRKMAEFVRLLNSNQARLQAASMSSFTRRTWKRHRNG
jgi:catechol 2,3-dioxygenase-like lactoylglutathione lyase family enzyme